MSPGVEKDLSKKRKRRNHNINNSGTTENEVAKAKKRKLAEAAAADETVEELPSILTRAAKKLAKAVANTTDEVPSILTRAAKKKKPTTQVFSITVIKLRGRSNIQSYFVPKINKYCKFRYFKNFVTNITGNT